MAVKGSTAKGVGKKVKSAPKAKPLKSEFKFYQPTAQASASEANIRNPKGSQNAPLGLYRPNKTGSISPRRISQLKQIRATEASIARIKSFRNAPNAGKSKLSQAGKRMAQSKKAPTSFLSTGERAPKKSFGVYRKISAAPADIKGTKDYRRDFNTVNATEKRNAQIHYSRQKSLRKKKK